MIPVQQYIHQSYVQYRYAFYQRSHSAVDKIPLFSERVRTKYNHQSLVVQIPAASEEHPMSEVGWNFRWPPGAPHSFFELASHVPQTELIELDAKRFKTTVLDHRQRPKRFKTTDLNNLCF